MRSANGMLWIIALLSVAPLIWSLQSAWVRLHQPNPQSPWETEILLDGWRASHGLPVYCFLSENDHSTHMYGALITYSVAAIFRATGFNTHAARWISDVAGVFLIVAILWAFARRHGAFFVFIAATMLMSCFYRARGYFSEGRPDVISIALSMVAVWMFYRAFARHTAWIVGGTIVMIVAFFYKQPASAICAVPGLVVLLLRPNNLVRKLTLATIPPAAVVITLVLLKVLAPRIYFFMITGPKLFKMHWDLLPEDIVTLITTNTVFVLMFALWMLGFARSSLSREATVWLLVIVGVETITNAIARVKEGGQVNGYLPSYIAMTVFAIAVLPHALSRFAEVAPSTWQRYALAGLVGCMIFADTTCFANHARWAFATDMYGDASYKKVLHRTQKLKGRVICPDDPTIPLQAKGYLGRSLQSEIDALGGYPMPSYLPGELARADYLIRVQGMWTSHVPGGLLRKKGYVLVKDPAFQGAYSLWKRKHKSAS